MKNPSLTQWSSLNAGFDEFFCIPFSLLQFEFSPSGTPEEHAWFVEHGGAETSDSVPIQLPKISVLLIRKSKHAKYTATHNLTLGRESICCM